MEQDARPKRPEQIDDSLWRKIELIYSTCGPDSLEWARVVALIASAELAERELAFQIVHGGFRFSSPN